MAQPVVIHIHPDGTIRFLNTEDAPTDLISQGVTRRASHVVPVCLFLRCAFRALRFVFGEKGWIAEFTRYWPCKWRVDLSPIGLPSLTQVFDSRRNAIEAEVAYLNENFI